MKTIFKISRAELRNLFYSPVAWFLGIIFMIQCAVFYTDVVYKLTKQQELGMKSKAFKGFGSALTRRIFLDPDGIFTNVMQNLYLFIPLLTMGILSREISNGSIKLLYSSPIKTRHIVFGKYLSLMIFSLILMAIVGVFMVSGFFNIESVDIGLLLSAALGFYLLVCAYAAIGLFMSSLTTYQIVSAIGTFIIIFILSRIGTLWQEIDFVRDLTYFLSMSGRTRKMLGGLITTKDVFYFLIIIAMFIGFTLLKLKSGRVSTPWYVTTGKYFAVIGFALVIGYVTSRPGLVGYLDTTSAQSNTIHPRVQEIVKGLGDDELEVTLYTNLFQRSAQHGLPKNRNTYLSVLWEKYVRFKPDIKFKYEYYYDLKPRDYMYSKFPGKKIGEIAKDQAKSLDLDLTMFKNPEEMRKQINLKDEDYNLVMQLKYKGKTTFLRTFTDSKVWPGEEHIAAALARLQGQKMPTVLFTTGNLERDINVTGERGFAGSTIAKGNRTSLINNGFDIDTISLDSRAIPVDSMKIAALVLADPKTALSPVVNQRVNDYIAAGGNMMILGESGKEDMLNPVLQPLGLQLGKGVLVQVTKNFSPDQVVPNLTRFSGSLAEEDVLLLLKSGEVNDVQSYTESSVPIDVIDSNKTFTKIPLSITDPGAVWLKKGKLVKDSVPPTLNLAEGDIKLDSFTTAMALTRKVNNKEQRIVVAGDADFLSNRYNGGQFFGRALYSWLSDNIFPIYSPVPPPKDNTMLIVPETASKLKLTYIWILPALLALIGAIVLIRRKRK